MNVIYNIEKETTHAIMDKLYEFVRERNGIFAHRISRMYEPSTGVKLLYFYSCEDVNELGELCREIAAMKKQELILNLSI